MAMNALLFSFLLIMFLSAYSSLSSYEAYEALTDKTKLNKRKYQETISPP